MRILLNDNVLLVISISDVSIIYAHFNIYRITTKSLNSNKKYYIYEK